MTPTCLLEDDHAKGDEYDLAASDDVTTNQLANAGRRFTIYGLDEPLEEGRISGSRTS
jgi:hypothetical protein